MTVDELKDYLTKLSDNGNGVASVTVANKSWNPITDRDDIVNVLTISWQSGGSVVVLQTD